MTYFAFLPRTKAAMFVLPIASAFFALPAAAMTLADSQGVFSFSNFSIAPRSTDSSVMTFTSTNRSDSLAIANADALFIAQPNPQASNSISNLAFGEFFSSSALAQSEASIIGDFAVAAGETLSFNFMGALDLLTSTEQPGDVASASLGIQYSVLALNSNTSMFDELDFLTLFGEINTPNGVDSISVENSNAIALALLGIENNTGAAQTTESISANIAGSYSRFFAQPTALTLAEVKVGAAAVEAQNFEVIPTPGISIVWWAGVIGAIAITRRQKLAGIKAKTAKGERLTKDE